ncbi:uncharacterized protein [Manis javanica]|uniref:uncharacterized protein n=1 Tax=Manis javanica TaxID=9974 RepID=UPI003C6CF248
MEMQEFFNTWSVTSQIKGECQTHSRSLGRSRMRWRSSLLYEMEKLTVAQDREAHCRTPPTRISSEHWVALTTWFCPVFMDESLYVPSNSSPTVWSLQAVVSSTASATFSSPPAVCRGHFLGTSCPADVHHGTPAAVPINKRGQGPANPHQICAEATSACSPDTKVPGEMSFPVSHRHHQPQNHSLCMAQPLSPRKHHYASLWDESLPTLQPPQPANNPPGCVLCLENYGLLCKQPPPPDIPDTSQYVVHTD